MAPMVVFAFGFKVATMYYGTLRDLGAANEAAKAYGVGGYKTNPVPKKAVARQRSERRR
eukprot:CAMPEP_0170241622 /NCGR_PEP_ID=MMETSP0116_2-20130129/20581_1 /TAXON_ID=400756 /ORGANISM="Durinskia baltica, Strain CSIRO CS-38" /LENGTH=58 /DNA_ID=CAMNT_0010492465 /DNA_START=84 /DNA_END=256 /DNA_ORIENTATION=+